MKKSSIENVKEVDNSASCGVVVYPFKEFKNQIKNIWLAHFPNNEPQKFQFSARIPIKDKFTLEHLKDNNINNPLELSTDKVVYFTLEKVIFIKS